MTGKLLLKINFIFLLACKISFAQTTIQSPNIPVAGDLWGNKTITDTTIQPGPGGSNMVWNFSTYFVNPGVISEAFNVLNGTGDDPLFPGANLKSTSLFGGNDYYYRTATQLQYLGFKNQSMEVIISNAQNILSAPLAYGDSIVNVAVTGTGVFGYPLSGTISVKADGKGNLTLYTGSFPNTLRLVTTMNLIVGAGSGNDTYVNITKYTWYSSLYRAPIFQIAMVDINGNLASVKQKVVTVGLLTSDVNSISNDLNLKISPNPARENASVKFNVSAFETELQLTDVTGKIVSTQNIQAGFNSAEIQVGELPDGIYFVTLTQNNIISRQKLIVE